MSPLIIELNDAELRVARGDRELAHSPGFATLVNAKVEVGDAGFAHAWLYPRHSHNRYWQQLDTTPLTTLGKRIRHAGDLAYLQLEQLRKHGGDDLRTVLIVPGGYQRAQLSLLLGIAQAAGLRVGALVESAVAVGATLAPGRYLHVETLLHHSVLTEIEVDSAHANKVRSEIITDVGTVHLAQAAVQCIERAFLTQCRFDPLHDAATEQLLHSHLAAWLKLWHERPEVDLTIDYRGTRHTARLKREELQSALTPLYQRLQRSREAFPAVLDSRLGRYPGLLGSWRSAALLPPTAPWQGVTLSPELATLKEGAVTLRTSLACVPGTRTTSSHTSPSASSMSATHVLVGYQAYALQTAPLFITLSGVSHVQPAESLGALRRTAHELLLDVPAHSPLRLNGQPLPAGSCTLALGDHLTVVGANLLIVPIMVCDAD